MPNYVPDATNVDRPTDSDRVQITEELRAIKRRIGEETGDFMDQTFPTQTVDPVASVGKVATGNVTIDLSIATFHHYRIAANTNFTFSHPQLASNEVPFFTLQLTNGGNFNVNWPSGTRFPYSAKPQLTQDGMDTLVFYKPFPSANYWIGGLPLVDIGAP